MSNLKLLLDCAFGPRLNAFFKINGRSLTEETPSALLGSNRYYKHNQLERASDNVLRLLNLGVQAGIYISPIILSYCFYKRHVPDVNFRSGRNDIFLFKILSTIVTIIFTTFALRGFGRYSNQDYLDFLRALNRAKAVPSDATKRIINHYDFEFKAWPADYIWAKSKLADFNNPPSPYEKTFPSSASKSNETQLNEGFFKKVTRHTMELISYVIMTTIGRRMIYPGSTAFFQLIMQPAILAGRAKLIEEHEGVRYKLVTYEQNYIDSMFVDRRNYTPNGETLVIGCEGNGGFYELGVMAAPLACGYSVLGWNHPGFAGSSGVPYPSQEVSAMDVVMKFAIDKLGFKPQSIIVHGWSIGGFTATWAGMRYPNVGGLIIDASFDSILPLALNIMPSVLKPLTQTAINSHFELNNSRHLSYHKGPVLLIRRTQDEVISTDPNNSPSTNRANNLLLDLLKQRFPNLIDEISTKSLHEYLAGGVDHQQNYLNRHSVNAKECTRKLIDHLRNSDRMSYPIEISADSNPTKEQLVLFLASKYMMDYDSLHCAPLPPSHFQRPWDLITLAQRRSNL